MTSLKTIPGRVSDEELERIKEEAKRMGMRPGNYVRQMLGFPALYHGGTPGNRGNALGRPRKYNTDWETLTLRADERTRRVMEMCRRDERRCMGVNVGQPVLAVDDSIDLDRLVGYSLVYVHTEAQATHFRRAGTPVEFFPRVA